MNKKIYKKIDGEGIKNSYSKLFDFRTFTTKKKIIFPLFVGILLAAFVAKLATDIYEPLTFKQLQLSNSGKIFEDPQQMDTNIRKLLFGYYKYANTNPAQETYFKNNPTDNEAIKFKNRYIEVSFNTNLNQKFSKTNTNASPDVVNNKITYKGIFPSTDLRYTIYPNQLLEEFIVSNPKQALQMTRISQTLSKDGIQKYEKLDDGSFKLFNKDVHAATIPRPVMYESSNHSIRSYDIHYEVSEENKNLQISKIIDKDGVEWLKDPNRNYPIVIDLVIDNADTAASWTSSDPDNTITTQETTIKQEGTGSVKVTTTAETDSSVDLMEYVPFSATGGTITYSGGYTIHSFTSSGTFTPNGTGEVEVLVVGGGGGGGETIGGGGGGGGIVESPISISNQGYSVTVGNGGAGGNGAGYPAGVKGGDSSFAGLIAKGGGAGAGYNVNASGTGGSAGGNGAGNGARAGYTVGQGHDGGTNGAANTAGGGGGGGAKGGDATSSVSGNGGAGYTSTITGSSVTYGGGGGGGARNGVGATPGTGGTGGGGNGGITTVGGNGTPNTGGGGGGGGYVAELAGGNGGSGIVIIRYLTNSVTKDNTYQSQTTSNTVTATGGTIQDVNGFRIHTFTSSGTFTPNGTMNVEVLVVGGGGGGGETIGGGGGGGGIIYNNSFSVSNQAYTVTVGSGGAGGNGAGYPAGVKGGDSTISSLTAIGGGAGAGYNVNASGTGGSAGGNGAGGGARAGYTVGQGYDGGAHDGSGNVAGGGGGAGATGGTASASVSGNGGKGLPFNISGELQYYGGGGGGGARNGSGTPGTGGSGGGGNGGVSTVGANGTANTGGGGGGGGYVSDLAGGNGGTGVVIIRYPLAVNEMPIGGIVKDLSGNYRAHFYKSVGTDIFVPTFNTNVEVLVVGGGGGGGETIGGGGGGGGVVYNSSYSVTAGQIYKITVGDGGAGGNGTGYPAGVKGENSIFGSITAIGGGAGAGYNVNASGTGGSAGGNGAGGGARAGYTVGQGYDGGAQGSTNTAGGGGGAGATGGTASASVSGNGGAGYTTSISGSSVTYGGGGGGGARNGVGATPGTGGSGGGGNGGLTTAGGDGTINTGGGGGGGGYVSDLPGGSGGSGIVIIRYVKPVISYLDTSIKTQGSYSLKGVATTNSLNRTLTNALSPAVNLTNYGQISFDIRSNRTGSNIKIGIHDTGGTTTEITPNITSANVFQTVDWDISGVSNSNKDSIDQIIVTIVNASSDNTFYIDNMTANIGSLNDTVTLTKTATDLSVSDSLIFWIRSDTVGSFMRFQFGETLSSEQTYPITINSPSTWEEKRWDLSSIPTANRDGVTKFAFEFTSDTSGAVVYFDNIILNNPPLSPTLDLPSNSATNQSLTPQLKTTTTDSESDYIRYKIEFCEDLAMTTNCQTFDQTSSQSGWTGQDVESGTAYSSGTQATYSISTPLSENSTYYWRSYAIDPSGSNTWSTTQGTPYSFTTSTAPSAPTTPYAEGATNPTGVSDTTPEFSAIVSDPDGDSANYYQIQVNTQSDFLGTSMWDSGKQSMTTTANGVRSPDISYAGTAIPLDGAGTTYYWRIKFWDVNGAEGSYTTSQSFAMNVKPNTPSLDSPTDVATDQDYLVALKTTATDNNSDYLRYKVEMCSNEAMTLDCQTFDQTVSQTGWSGQNTETSTAYTSGTQATYTVQSALTPSTTYYWRSYTIDPSGSNTWSTTQGTPYSFTTTSLNHPTLCRVEKAPDNSYLTIKWSDNSVAEANYEIQKNTDGGGFSLLQTLAANSVSHQDNSVSNGHTYQYRVAAVFSGSQYSEWCTTGTVSLSTNVNTFGIN